MEGTRLGLVPTAIAEPQYQSPTLDTILGEFHAPAIHLLPGLPSGRFPSKFSTVTRVGYGLDDQGSIPGRSEDFFLFTAVSRQALGPTQPPINWVPGALSSGIKRPGREADHSPLTSAEAKNEWSYTSIRLHGVIIKQVIRIYDDVVLS
jgi:hypothetical protein